MKNKKTLFPAAPLLLLLPLASAVASDLVLCNEGTVKAAAALAYRNGSGLFGTFHTWTVTGWFTVEPDKCETVFSNSNDEPIYVALAFTDFMGDWGAFSSAKGGSDDVFHDTDVELCVAGDEFEYTRSGSDPGVPCKDGYYPFPATLYITPNGDRSENTFTFEINHDNVVVPVNVPRDTRSAAQSSGGSVGKAAAVAGGIVAALIIGKAIYDQLDSSSDPSSPPSPLAAGTLNARLLGRQVTRRVTGTGAWYYTDGSRVNPVYQLDGKIESDLLDAPVQREVNDAAVGSALAILNNALSGFARNRPSEVLNMGRLYYGFEDGSGVLHRALTNLAALDFARGRRIGEGGGITGVEIPCRGDRACTIGFNEDRGGNRSSSHIYSSIIFYFANSQDGGSLWNALLKLRSLYPAEPAVIAR